MTIDQVSQEELGLFNTFMPSDARAQGLNKMELEEEQPWKWRCQERVAAFFLGVRMGRSAEDHGLECGGQHRH